VKSTQRGAACIVHVLKRRRAGRAKRAKEQAKARVVMQRTQSKWVTARMAALAVGWS
jgi:hypothetical protein